MAAPRSWKDAMVAAGAVAVSHVPEASLGRADIDEVARPDVVIASSSSGLLPSRIQDECRHPERILVVRTRHVQL